MKTKSQLIKEFINTEIKKQLNEFTSPNDNEKFYGLDTLHKRVEIYYKARAWSFNNQVDKILNIVHKYSPDVLPTEYNVENKVLIFKPAISDKIVNEINRGTIDIQITQNRNLATVIQFDNYGNNK